MPLRFSLVTDPEQVARVETLARSIWQEYYTPLIGPGQVSYMLEQFQSAGRITQQIQQGSRYYLLVIAEGVEAGYLALDPRPQELFLSKLYIAKEHRGRGYARQAVEFAVRTGRSLGLERISLTVNKQNQPSIKVYQHLGFEILEPIVVDIGGGFSMDDYRMGRPLT